MIRRLVCRFIAHEERRFGVPLDYLRELADCSVGAFVKLLLVSPLANHRRKLPRDAYHLARLTALLAEDCGTCVQIVVYFARRDGVDAEPLRAVLDNAEDRLPGELRDVILFAREISCRSDAPELRERLRHLYGDTAVTELAMAIAIARFFPTFKRALGHATACASVR